MRKLSFNVTDDKIDLQSLQKQLISGLAAESDSDSKTEIKEGNGEKVTPMCLIVKGSAKVIFRDPEGSSHEITTLRTGDAIGLADLLHINVSAQPYILNVIRDLKLLEILWLRRRVWSVF